MIITYNGHAQFLIETASGHRILTDPFDETVGYPCKEKTADVVTVSHQHHDHNYLKKVTNSPIVLDKAGNYTPLDGIKISAITAFHDDEQGKLRGETLMFKYEIDGLTLAHLGDLGCLPNQEQYNFLMGVDILFVPIGGTYTLDTLQAKEVVQKIHPRCTIPMHYRDEDGGIVGLLPPEPFVKLFTDNPQKMPLCRVTKEDLSQQPKLIWLAPTP